MALPLVKILCLCMIPCFILALIGTIISGAHLYDGCDPLNCTYSSSIVSINETIYKNCTIIVSNMNNTQILTSCSWITNMCPISDIIVPCFLGKQTIPNNITSPLIYNVPHSHAQILMRL